MKGLSLILWFMDRPLMIMDIGIKIIIFVSAYILYRLLKKMKTAKDLQMESFQLSEKSYQLIRDQYEDLNKRYISLMEKYRSIRCEYDELTGNRDLFISKGLQFIEETEDHQISESEFNALVQTYLIKIKT